MTETSTKLHQATGVAIGGRGVLIEGAPGSGKSSLALALIDRGAQLVGDDGVTLTVCGGRLLAGSPPHTDGLIEVRNIGLIVMPAARNVAIALVLRLDSAAPRFVEVAERAQLMGLSLPMIRLWPDSPVLHLRAEAALARYGLA